MEKDGSKLQGGCLCLGTPMRALSRACDSACDLYVRGMSGCARRVPAGGAVAVGRGFGSRSATSMHLWSSSDRAEDLVRAASKQRRVVAVGAAGPAYVGPVKKGSRLGQAPAVVPARRKGPAMGTIAEDAPCEFGACALKPRTRGAAAGGLGARAGGFGAIKLAGSAACARQA